MIKPTLLQLFSHFDTRHNKWDAWRDFCACAAIAISNRVDHQHYDEREERYKRIVQRYTVLDVMRFKECLCALTDEISEYPTRDVLGEAFAELGLTNDRAGQFFTPSSLSTLLAKLQIPDAKLQIAQQGMVTLHDPAIGSGSMVIGMANAMRAEGLNYQTSLFVEGWDIDERAIHMCYLQLALLHIPARLIHGDTLRQQQHAIWCTPAYFMRKSTSIETLNNAMKILAA